MTSYDRYAVYFSPRPGTVLAKLGREWFGVDAEEGWVGPAPSPYVESPRRYGFHATLKAPMRLAQGCDYHAFRDAVASLAQDLKPADMGVLRLKRIGSFLALTTAPEKHQTVADLAWTCVQALDGFRAPLTDKERAKRKDLTPEQKELMEEWGYPYVSDAFRFHMTLSSSLEQAELEAAEQAVAALIPSEPASLDSIAIFGDPGMSEPFALVERFDLKG